MDPMDPMDTMDPMDPMDPMEGDNLDTIVFKSIIKLKLVIYRVRFLINIKIVQKKFYRVCDNFINIS